MQHGVGGMAVRLVDAPTPLQNLTRLTKDLDGPDLLMKRDDVMPLGGGGNKLRKLERLLSDALSRGADTVITPGALQSNHARLTAAAAAQLGLRCILVLTDSVANRDEIYRRVGNFLLFQVFGAELRMIPGSEESAPVMEEVAEEERRRGAKPYVIPLGGSNALGSEGYAAAFDEMRAQARRQLNSDIDAVVVASGSGGTQAGLIAGALEANWRGEIVGISVGRPASAQKERIVAILEAMRPGRNDWRERIEVDDRFAGGGYGQPTVGMVRAVQLVARREGILLDPVYTGKAMDGLLSLIREKRFRKGQTVAFLHTGGSPALSAYWQSLSSDPMTGGGDDR
jgi:D-cysteine desulfhydrase/L-cysteate sulfo-lyase